ncbi:hypothetical protein [Rhizobium giardinii]|uniref:Uncharacterized protein n=1 Tax=Rhizobium giardinii TaxID=56731 RepID=A0A7W8UJR6_9HYPH|nr:hypothetical protein [Rhizobium giardinii]MBB5539475.1 hypothetical protein [Rhizobium giardinii]
MISVVNCITTKHNIWLVLVAALVCVSGGQSFASSGVGALSLARKRSAGSFLPQLRRRVNLVDPFQHSVAGTVETGTDCEIAFCIEPFGGTQLGRVPIYLVLGDR